MRTRTLLLPLVLALSCGGAAAGVIPLLGEAQQFAVLGAQSVTYTNINTLQGNLGVAPGSAFAGTGQVNFASGGARHQADATAIRAYADANAAYGRLASLTGGTDLSGQDLGSTGSFTAGVYRFSAAAALTGTMTIDFANDPNGIVVFQIGSALTTASNAVVNVLNGTSSNGIYFQVGSSATLGENTAFAGNILALQSVSFASAAGITCGRAFALGGAVTMNGATVSSDCNAYAPTVQANDFGSKGFSGDGTSVMAPGEVPEPATLALFGAGLCAAALRRRIKPAALN
ncbi:DUF3494 domain-containing protein [Telluria aromaticivorans]|uniref:DUF3494 domain-containing protein n=1 Tax=Telluria aromaticivorans TaxID=2725995 RepID=A0A7Y2K289_9BURK|nr:DUF3494 domain-containing protein [Telluria aromaticivorans]NNG24079.1 DUF3494 domain-containing protein [Telluria aromaticivorans]